MKVYIATAFENAQAARDLAKRLPPGWSWSYDWTGHTFDDDPARVAHLDMCGVTAADAVIVILPGGPGTHVELGIALGRGIHVCVVGHAPRKDPRWPRCPFYLLCDRVETPDGAVAWLQGIARAGNNER